MADTKDVLLEQALAKQQRTLDLLDLHMSKLNKMKSQIERLKEAHQNNREPISEQSKIRFLVQSSYHKWPQTGQFVSDQDYTVTLDFLNPEHNEKLQQQMDQWLAQGWSIQRSESKKSPKNDADLLLIRLIR